MMMGQTNVGRRYGFLDGIRIVDCSASLLGGFAAHVLAGYGAEVVRLELDELRRKGATPFVDTHLRRLPHYASYLDAGKVQVRAELDSEDGRQKVAGTLTGADVVVVDFARESVPLFEQILGDVVDAAPTTIVTHLSPYGVGEREDRAASDLTMYLGGGPGFATPGLVADPKTMAPLRPRSHQGHLASGLTAAINIVSALLQRRSVGESRVSVDFSAFEAMANMFRQNLCTYAFHAGGLNRDLARGRGAGGTADQQNLPCADGWVNLNYTGVKQWEALRDMLGHPEWMTDERLATPALRYRNWTVSYQHLSDWMADRSKAEVFNLAQAFGIPSAPVNTGAEVLSDEMLEGRAFWDDSGASRAPGGMALITFRQNSEAQS